MGALGTGGTVIKREDLPAVREAEQRAVLEVMKRVEPDVVIPFGPTGLSNHADHIAMHHAATVAFERYRKTAAKPSVRYYWALNREIVDAFDLGIDGIEVEPNVFIDGTSTWSNKIQALRMYASQEDAQQIATLFEESEDKRELFHLVYPPVPATAVFDDLFHE
jgi:LmbE family N-acetylglucosaminyl deacetylase